MEKLTLDQVQKLPACVAEINEDNTKVTIKSPSGEAKCAISANEKSDAFDAIREKIESLPADGSEIHFGEGVKAYGYGSLSKGKEGLFSGANVSRIRNGKNFDVSNVTDMSYLFKDSSLAVDFFYVNVNDPTSLIGWDVSKVTNMEGMFEGCTGIENLNGMRDWNVSKVTNMKNMFEGCTYLDNISGLSGWAKKVGSVTDMSGMFEGCTSLESLTGLENWDVSKVGSMSGMFASIIKNEDKRDNFNPDGYEGLMAIKSLKPLSHWNVGNVGNMNRMFEGCTRLKDFTGLEKWDTKKVSSMIGMFRYCNGIGKDKVDEKTGKITEYFEALKPLSKWNVGNVGDMRGMFAVCTYIQNTVGLEKWNVSNVTKMDDMFAMCTNLNSIKGLANWNKTNSSSASELISTSRMFYQCSSLTSLDPLSSWNVGKVTDMHDMFNNCGSLTSLQPLKDWNVGSVTDMSSMFSSCNGLTSLDSLSGWNVGSVTDMSSMFSSCNSLSNLKGLENWNVGSVTHMSSMFSGCATDIYSSGDDPNPIGIKGLADISALSKWNVSNVTDMSSMFSSCNNLSNLKGLENWNVGNVTNMSSMFSHEASGSDFDKLTDISGLSKWNVSNVTDMSSMFNSCKSLKSIEPLSGWAREASGDIKASNVSNVTDMSSMFSGCQSLTGNADLSNWDISKVTNLSSMFSGVGAESGDKLVLDFSNKTFTKSSTPVYTDDDGTKHYFSVDGMFDGFKGTLIANNLQSSGFENNTEDDPIAKHFASGDIFSIDEKGHSNNIVITNNVTILDTISNDDDLKKITYYIPVKAKLMEPGDMDSCKCDGSGDFSGTTTYYVPALYSSKKEGEEGSTESILRGEGESLQDYAYRVVRNSFASKFRSAIDSQSGKSSTEEEPGEGEEEGTGEGADDTGEDTGDSRSAKLKLRVKKLQSVKALRSARKSRSVRGDDDEGSEEGEEGDEEQGNTYKIMFKKSSGNTCTWTELIEGEDVAASDNQKSPLAFFNTMYYLETFVKPVPLPHTGGQSAVMFTFLSIGLFSMFAVAGAFARRSA